MKRKLKAIIMVFLFGAMAFTFQVAADSATQPDSSNANTSAEKTTSAQLTPKVVFPQTRYEFEPVLEGAEIKHDFIIENHGEAPLVIQNVRPD